MKRGFGVVLVVIFALVVGLCVACIDDDDQADDVGWRPASHGENSRGDCGDRSTNCSDDDFSPDLDDSPVILCLPGSTCHFA